MRIFCSLVRIGSRCLGICLGLLYILESLFDENLDGNDSEKQGLRSTAGYAGAVLVPGTWPGRFRSVLAIVLFELPNARGLYQEAMESIYQRRVTRAAKALYLQSRPLSDHTLSRDDRDMGALP